MDTRDPAEHVHDWRVDPRIVLESVPLQNRLVCAECGRLALRRMPPGWDPQVPLSKDPHDWDKASVEEGLRADQFVDSRRRTS